MRLVLKIACGLLLAVTAFAGTTDVAPFVFKNDKGVAYDESEQQSYWDELLKYKLFGTHGIGVFGTRLWLGETGRTGTVSGSINMGFGNDNHYIGGPVLVGGDLILSESFDTLSTGPVRVTGDMVYAGGANWYASSEFLAGDYCVKGSMDSKYVAIVRGNVYADEDYGNCPESVPQINTSLRIPVVDFSEADVHGKISVSNDTAFIDVPEGSGVFDYYVAGIQFLNNAVLVVRMPSGGRPTRIFVGEDGFDFSGHSSIRVGYVDDDVEWNGTTQSWKTTGTKQTTLVENKDYAGNLLFYTNENIRWPAMDVGHYMQGSFISAGGISVGQHMDIVGQLLADTVSIEDHVYLSYVPFNSTVAVSEPTLVAKGSLIESDNDSLVDVTLSEAPGVDVSFRYCFDVAEEAAEGYASIGDFLVTAYAKFPICGNSQYETVEIKAGTTRPTTETRIYINVKRDGNREGSEILPLKIYDLSGAVLAGNEHEGVFNLTIVDALPAFAHDFTQSYSIYENSPSGLVVYGFPVENTNSTDGLVVSLMDFNPSAKVQATDAFDVKFATSETSVYVFLLVKDPSLLDYESLSSFFVSLSLSDDKGVELDTVIRTIKVLDLNEPPTIIPDACDGIGCLDVLNIGVYENESEGQVILEYAVTDEDAGDVDDVVVTVKERSSSVDNGTMFADIFGYSYDATTHKITLSVKDNRKLDYEALRVARSRTDPDPEYEISIIVTDPKGLADTVDRVIRILDMDEIPSFVPKECVVVEGNAVGDSIGRVGTPSDPDLLSRNSKFYDNDFEMIGGNTELFHLEKGSDGFVIKLVADVELDCENGMFVCGEKGAYSVELRYGNSSNGIYATVPVTLVDVNEPPTIITDTIYVEENSPKGTFVDYVKWADVDRFDTTLVFAISDLSGCFEIDASSGAVSVKTDECAALDYEKNPQIPIKVSVTDSLGQGFTVSKRIVVEVIDVAEKNETVLDKDSLWNSPDTTRTDNDSDSIDVRDDVPSVADTVKTESDTDGPKIEVKQTMQSVYLTIASIADEKVVLNEYPESEVTRVSIDDGKFLVSYVEKIGGVEVTVSFTTDNVGNVKTKSVVDSDGQKTLTEVIKVTYETEVDGKKVTASYQADAASGEILAEDAAGNLMTSRAAMSKMDVGFYTVSYDKVDEIGNVTKVTYKVDERRNVVKGSVKEGDIQDDDGEEEETDGEEVFAEPSFRVEMTGPFQFTIVMEEAVPSLNSAVYAVMDLQGRVIRTGRIDAAETVVPMPRAGSYVVRVGLRTRRVNLI